MPVPPPSNHQYIPIIMKGPRPMARLIPSSELTAYKKQCDAWAKENFLICGKARQVCNDWRIKGYVIRLDLFFFFHGTRIYTQNMEIRRFDITNRIKATEDAVSEILQIDDKEFFKVTGEKCETKNTEPFCNALLRPWKARAFDAVKAEEGE